MSELLTAREVAQELGINERTVRRWIGEGRLDAPKQGGEYRIRLEDAREVLAGSRPGATQRRAVRDSYIEWLEQENERLWALLDKAVSR